MRINNLDYCLWNTYNTPCIYQTLKHICFHYLFAFVWLCKWKFQSVAEDMTSCIYAWIHHLLIGHVCHCVISKTGNYQRITSECFGFRMRSRKKLFCIFLCYVDLHDKVTHDLILFSKMWKCFLSYYRYEWIWQSILRNPDKKTLPDWEEIHWQWVPGQQIAVQTPLTFPWEN